VGQHAKFTPFLFFQNNKSQIKKLTTENKKLKNQNKKLKDKNKKLKEQVENLKCKNENLREEYDNLYNSKIYPLMKSIFLRTITLLNFRSNFSKIKKT